MAVDARSHAHPRRAHPAAREGATSGSLLGRSRSHGTDDALESVRVGALPVDLPACPAAAEVLVAAARARRQLWFYVALGDVEKQPVAARTPRPGTQRRGEPVQDLAELRVRFLMVDVRPPAECPAV